MESNCTKMQPRGSKYTAALKHGQIFYQNLHTTGRPKSGQKKFQSLIRFFEIQLINITSSIESAISGAVDYKILMIWYGMDPTQTSLLK